MALLLTAHVKPNLVNLHGLACLHVQRGCYEVLALVEQSGVEIFV